MLHHLHIRYAHFLGVSLAATSVLLHVPSLLTAAEKKTNACKLGTTGKPKGVDVTHRNVTNLVCMSPGNLDIRPGKRVGQVLNISFDMGMWLPEMLFTHPPIAAVEMNLPFANH